MYTAFVFMKCFNQTVLVDNFSFSTQKEFIKKANKIRRDDPQNKYFMVDPTEMEAIGMICDSRSNKIKDETILTCKMENGKVFYAQGFLKTFKPKNVEKVVN